MIHNEHRLCTASSVSPYYSLPHCSTFHSRHVTYKLESCNCEYEWNILVECVHSEFSVQALSSEYKCYLNFYLPVTQAVFRADL